MLNNTPAHNHTVYSYLQAMITNCHTLSALYSQSSVSIHITLCHMTHNHKYNHNQYYPNHTWQPLFHLWNAAPCCRSYERITKKYQSYKLMLLVAVSVGVAFSINVNMTLAQAIENRLFGLNHCSDVIVLNF